MLESLLICCKLYISETRNSATLKFIEQAAKQHPAAVIINKFEDEVYNRVRYTLVSTFDATPLRNAVFDMVKAASESIDLEFHSGTHPRLGVVDDICFHPLGRASLDQAAEIARSLALDIGQKLQIPVYLYGAADEEGRTLDGIRRELGYFVPNSDGNQWTGGLAVEMLPFEPDAGPLQPSPAKGIVAIGAMRWVGTYNVPVWSTDIEAVQMIAKKVSERGGGLKSVQTIGVAHGEDCIEVACYLLDPSIVGADQVQREVERLASEEGFEVGDGYFTDFSQEKLVEKYFKSVNCDQTRK
ncbi:hypothetical protein Cni_G22098 [Canna indica]|uniref:glutamate formimidoyltransferase n=1 Tax=Canna indica TaxID=4628 RepID=A0AAQ3KUH9_9LILI|nr:hypothetical protein Cni_G22098 [Canna indica]